MTTWTRDDLVLIDDLDTLAGTTENADAFCLRMYRVTAEKAQRVCPSYAAEALELAASRLEATAVTRKDVN